MVAICHDGVGAFFALFDICANLMVCCQSRIRSSSSCIVAVSRFIVLVGEGFLAWLVLVLCDKRLSVVTFVTMSGTVAIGVDGVIEVDGANIQVLANVAARGEVTFILLPGQLYSVHLHDANGRLIGVMRLDIPGGGDNTSDAEDGGEDSPYGSGQVARPQARRRAREVLRPRRSRPMRCAFRRRRGTSGGSRDDQSVRDDDGIPANMAIRTRDRSPRTRDRSPRRRPSSSSDVDVVGE